MKTDRRQGTRLRLAFTVLIDGPFGLRRCVGRDLSSGGLFVETPDPYASGTIVRVIFSVPDGTSEMTARCEVRHTLQVKGAEGTVRGVGLSFLGFDLEADDLISAARRVHA